MENKITDAFISWINLTAFMLQLANIFRDIFLNNTNTSIYFYTLFAIINISLSIYFFKK